MKKYKNSKRKAFTLIEMLVVIAIIGIILIIVIPSVSSVLNNKDNKLYQTHMLTVEAATKTYIDQNKGQLNEINSSCFNIDYKLLLKENRTFLINELYKRDKQLKTKYVNRYYQEEDLQMMLKGVSGDKKWS